MHPTKQRATRADEKESRRQQLLDAAYTLSQSTPYDLLTVPFARLPNRPSWRKGRSTSILKAKKNSFWA